MLTYGLQVTRQGGLFGLGSTAHRLPINLSPGLLVQALPTQQEDPPLVCVCVCMCVHVCVCEVCTKDFK